MSMLLALSLLASGPTPFVAGAAVDPSPGSNAPVGCGDGAFSAVTVDDPSHSLRAAGVSVARDVRIVSVAKAPPECDANVAAVFGGGVLARSGDSWSERPSGFENVGGGGTYYRGVECPGAGFRKCLDVPGVRKRYVVLRDGSISLFADGRTTSWISVGNRTRIVDMAYLPTADAPGGRVFAYFRTSRGGYFATFEVGA